MTKDQQITYMAMRLARILSNTEGERREYWLRVLEQDRKKLGGIQFAPTPQEIPHKSELQHNPQEMDRFPECPKCKRMLHYSVISGVCYSCGRS